MVSNPAVSVIIPTYNRAQLIGRAIKSVLNQTYQDFEIIIVDDASTENPEKIVLAPKRWVNSDEWDTRDLIPDGWERI